MKKVILLFVLLFALVSCGRTNTDINYTYDIVYKECDMSAYEGVNSTKHMFKSITVDQLFNCIDNKSSGVFYLGRENCGCCQTCVKYLNEAAQELGVTVYYIDVYNEDMPLTTTEICSELKEYIYDILEVKENGERELETPTVFSVINGEFADSIVCMNRSSEEKMVQRYKKILKPFANQSQD